MSSIRRFATVSEQLPASFETAFSYITKPLNLYEWAVAFKHSNTTSAMLDGPNGNSSVGLTTEVSKEAGTIDWYMDMPDGSVMRALSRLVASNDDQSVYTFTFFAENIEDDQVEAHLTESRAVIEQEFSNLQQILGS